MYTKMLVRPVGVTSECIKMSNHSNVNKARLVSVFVAEMVCNDCQIGPNIFAKTKIKRKKLLHSHDHWFSTIYAHKKHKLANLAKSRNLVKTFGAAQLT